MKRRLYRHLIQVKSQKIRLLSDGKLVQMYLPITLKPLQIHNLWPRPFLFIQEKKFGERPRWFHFNTRVGMIPCPDLRSPKDAQAWLMAKGNLTKRPKEW